MINEGFGAVNAVDFRKLREELSLNKALEAGHAVPGYEGGGSGAALIPQDLEGTMAAMRVPTEKQIKVWWRLFKDKAFSTVVEYTRLTSLGDDTDGFISEMDLPAVTNSEYERDYEKVKYLAVLRLVSDVMASVKTIVSPNALAEASQRALQKLLVQTERALFFGDTRVNRYAWKGMIQAAEEAGNAVDLRGKPLTPDALEDALGSLVDAPNYASPDAVYMPFFAQTDMGKIGGSNLRYVPGMGPSQNQVLLGVRPTAILSPNGDEVSLEPHAFLKPEGAPPESAVGEDQVAAPSIADASAANDDDSLFGTNDAGTYTYKAVAVGLKGRSAAGAQASVSVAAGQKVSLTIHDENASKVEYYKVYRSEADSSDVAYIGAIAQARDANGNATDTVFTDRNESLPGTGVAVIAQHDPLSMKFKQLLPVFRRPIPYQGLGQLFAFLLFGTPLYENPAHLMVIKNIGRAE